MQENIKISHYWSFLRRIHWWPMDKPNKGPAMRKALIMQLQDCRSIFVSSILWKKYILAATTTLNEHQRISYHWQLYCLLNSQYRKHKRKHQSSARLLPCGGNHRWPMESPHKGSAMWKIVHHAILVFQVHLCCHQFRKDKLYTIVTTHVCSGISFC